jgi:hypothetical protein
VLALRPRDVRRQGLTLPNRKNPSQPVKTAHLAAAHPSPLKLQDDRVIRLLVTLLHPGAFASDWTTRELHARVLAQHRLAGTDYRLSQLRYDLAKLRAKGLVERLGRTRRYRLTRSGARIGVLLVKLRARLLGPLAAIATNAAPRRPPLRHNSLDAAFHQVDTTLDNLCSALGLQHAA